MKYRVVFNIRGHLIVEALSKRDAISKYSNLESANLVKKWHVDDEDVEAIEEPPSVGDVQ